MAVNKVASSLSSKINIWYLDETTLGSPAESVFADIRKCVTELKKMGLKDNPAKCEIINMSYPVNEFTELVMTLASDLPGLKILKLADMELLSSVNIDQAVKKAIANKLHTYHLMTHHLQQLDTCTRVSFFSRMLSLSPSSPLPILLLPMLPSF